MPNFLNIYTCIDNIDSEGNIHTSGQIMDSDGTAMVLNDIQYFSLDDYMNYTRKICSTAAIGTDSSISDYGLFMTLGKSDGEISEDSYALDRELFYSTHGLQFQSMSIEFKPSNKIIYSGNLIVKNVSSDIISINQIALFTRACFNIAKGQLTPTYKNYMLVKENIETIEMQPGETRMFSMAIKS